MELYSATPAAQSTSFTAIINRTMGKTIVLRNIQPSVLSSLHLGNVLERKFDESAYTDIDILGKFQLTKT